MGGRDAVRAWPRASTRLAALVLLLRAIPCFGQVGKEGDIFDFFREEAEAVRVVTASRLSESLRWAPATVYVVTGEEIRASGVKTLWDALRRVPGVDVMSTRAFYGEVSIRGMNRALENRTLVLLDGRTVLNGPFDSTYWEGIPVTLEEVDRIEVVEGPASALYGANAVNGVINILTKSPERLNGGQVSYTAGERNTHLGSLTYGRRRGGMGYRWGGGFRRTDRFEGDGRASRVGMVNGALEGASGTGEWSLSGGFVDHDTGFSMGSPGAGYFEGNAGFLRLDHRHRDTRIRGFWNRGRQELTGFPVSQAPDARSDVLDLNVEQTVSPFPQNTLVVGGSYRRSVIRSNTYDPGRVRQNLWALFFEDAWRIGGQFRLVVSGRRDWHPLTKWVFSPRGSLVFSPHLRHSLRISLGKSFRNPTATESYVALRQPYGAFRNVPIHVEVRGNPRLKPERLVMADASYNGRFGPLRVVAAGFFYQLDNVITVEEDRFELVFQPTPMILTGTRHINHGVTTARGGEVGAEAVLDGFTTVSANYSYQRITGGLDYQVSTKGGPRHKANGGVRVQAGGMKVSLSVNGVGRTFWNSADLETLTIRTRKVDGYVLLNASLSHTFSGALKGLELGLEAFNALNHDHFELLPEVSSNDWGHQGEVIRRRLTATLSCRF